MVSASPPTVRARAKRAVAQREAKRFGERQQVGGEFRLLHVEWNDAQPLRQEERAQLVAFLCFSAASPGCCSVWNMRCARLNTGQYGSGLFYHQAPVFHTGDQGLAHLKP